MAESSPSRVLASANRGPAPSTAPPTPAAHRKLGLLVFVLPVFLAVWVGAHTYLALRLIVAPEWPAALTTWLLVGMGVLGSSLVLQPIAERFMPDWVERIVVWPASVWMGVAFFSLIGLLFSDFVLLLLGAAGGVEPVAAARIRAFLVVVFVVPTVLIALRQGLAPPGIERVEIRLDRWPAVLDGFRIVQISDIHLGPILRADFAIWLKDQVNALEPDLIAITGDLVDGPVSKVRDHVAPLAELSAPLGSYFVTGNHDHYSGARSWSDHVAELGIRVLRNEHIVLEANGACFVLAGVDDHRSRQLPGEGGEDLDAALSDIDSANPVILMAHDPTTFRTASEHGVDLQLSGHTHGGQIWPFNYIVRLAIPWVAGLYRRAAATLYVSRGTGFWGPPMRLGAPAEITEIVLRSGSS